MNHENHYINKTKSFFWKSLKYTSITILVLLLLVYVGFYIMMEVTSGRWSPKAPHHASMDIHSQVPHQVKLLDNGMDSLTHRLQLIRSAKKSIDLEFFIYNLDESSRIITQALASRSREGIKVRVLVDFSLAVFQLSPAFAKKMQEAGIEVKYYNTTSALKFFTVQHRTHRKMLIADSKEAIFGGRNIANDYFDLSTHYNFLDSDLLINGPIVKAMRESFDVYWHSEWAIDPDHSQEVTESEKDSMKFLDEESIDAKIRAQFVDLKPLADWSQCRDVQYVTDYPGSGEGSRRLYPAILKVLASAKKDLLVETPYFIIRPEGMKAIKSLVERGVKMQVLTNSLQSTDAYYTVAAMIPTLSELKSQNLTVWAYKGAPLEHYSESRKPASIRWGIHSKRAVVDDDTVMLGTYNIDPRSANLNSELMVICRNSPELAAKFRKSIESRIAQSGIVVKDKEGTQIRNAIGDASAKNILLMILAMPVASWFDFLL